MSSPAPRASRRQTSRLRKHALVESRNPGMPGFFVACAGRGQGRGRIPVLAWHDRRHHLCIAVTIPPTTCPSPPVAVKWPPCSKPKALSSFQSLPEAGRRAEELCVCRKASWINRLNNKFLFPERRARPLRQNLPAEPHARLHQSGGAYPRLASADQRLLLIRPDLFASSLVLSPSTPLRTGLSKHSPSIVRQAHDQGERYSCLIRAGSIEMHLGYEDAPSLRAFVFGSRSGLEPWTYGLAAFRRVPPCLLSDPE